MRTKSIAFPNSLQELETLFDKLQRVATNKMLVSGVLALDTGEPLPVISQDMYYMLDGHVYLADNSTVIAPLDGTVTADKFNVYVYTLDSAGDTHCYMGTEGATLAAVVFPEIPDGEVAMGFISVNPTGTGNFVGGTDDLDDGTVVPNAVFYNPLGSFLPELTNL